MKLKKITEINITPNPANQYINIAINGKKIENYAIFNIEGKAINLPQVSLSDNELTLDIKNLTSGMYFIKLYSDNGKSYSKSFVVE